MPRCVIGNLVTNAARATSAGGRVAVAASQRGDEVAISVSDTGVGIPRDYFERWNGTLVTTMFGRKSSAPLMSSDVWLCSRCCHQLAGTNSGRMTVT